jgi:threonine aldolase
MTSFESDYNNGAHSEVLRHLIETNGEQSLSYGFDQWSESARHKIRTACQCPDAEIFFLVGGTQTNATVIDGVLTGYEGVIAVDTGHINVHESGAVEAFGHKIIILPSHNGKLTADDLRDFHNRFYADPVYEHMVIPGIVYITFPTELGTLYKASEIEAIYQLCQNYEVPLFIDGARLGYGLMSDECDFDLPWLAHHCDVFYIGGTKVGALCGEAVVFPRGNAPRHFFNIVKQHGALLAKSRLAGVQFDALFTDGLYFNIARHAIEKAMQMRQLFKDAGLSITDSPTNQQFVVLTPAQIEQIRKTIAFETWEPIDDNHTLCRFVTSWATTDADMQELASALKAL